MGKMKNKPHLLQTAPVIEKTEKEPRLYRFYSATKHGTLRLLKDPNQPKGKVAIKAAKRLKVKALQAKAESEDAGFVAKN